jgi:charged multivesicular body protein 2B
MISDSIDGALDDDELEDETDDLTNQVLDEIGIDVAAQVRLSCFSGFYK